MACAKSLRPSTSSPKGLQWFLQVHPRTQSQIKKHSIDVARGVRLIEPLGYLDFLHLMSKARLVLTDSGGYRRRPRCCGFVFDAAGEYGAPDYDYRRHKPAGRFRCTQDSSLCPQHSLWSNPEGEGAGSVGRGSGKTSWAILYREIQANCKSRQADSLTKLEVAAGAA